MAPVLTADELALPPEVGRLLTSSSSDIGASLPHPDVIRPLVEALTAQEKAARSAAKAAASASRGPQSPDANDAAMAALDLVRSRLAAAIVLHTLCWLGIKGSTGERVEYVGRLQGNAGYARLLAGGGQGGVLQEMKAALEVEAERERQTELRLTAADASVTGTGGDCGGEIDLTDDSPKAEAVSVSVLPNEVHSTRLNFARPTTALATPLDEAAAPAEEQLSTPRFTLGGRQAPATVSSYGSSGTVSRLGLFPAAAGGQKWRHSSSTSSSEADDSSDGSSSRLETGNPFLRGRQETHHQSLSQQQSMSVASTPVTGRGHFSGVASSAGDGASHHLMSLADDDYDASSSAADAAAAASPTPSLIAPPPRILTLRVMVGDSLLQDVPLLRALERPVQLPQPSQSQQSSLFPLPFSFRLVERSLPYPIDMVLDEGTAVVMPRLSDLARGMTSGQPGGSYSEGMKAWTRELTSQVPRYRRMLILVQLPTEGQLTTELARTLQALQISCLNFPGRPLQWRFAHGPAQAAHILRSAAASMILPALTSQAAAGTKISASEAAAGGGAVTQQADELAALVNAASRPWLVEEDDASSSHDAAGLLAAEAFLSSAPGLNPMAAARLASTFGGGGAGVARFARCHPQVLGQHLAQHLGIPPSTLGAADVASAISALSYAPPPLQQQQPGPYGGMGY